jgi:DNA-binding beta-propeller fold protein YncE
MRVFTVSLLLLLILIACTPIAPNQVEPTTAPPDIAPTSTVEVVKGTLETSLLAAEWRGNGEGNVLFPLDPASGTALPGYTPISLGQTFTHAFSPDQRMLAAVTFPNQYAQRGSLLLIDLATWGTQQFDLNLNGWVSTMIFSPDGKRLAIAHGETIYRLTLIEVEQGIIIAQSKVDAYATRMKFTQSGDALMLYSPAISLMNELNASPPQALLLDGTDLSPLWSTELKGVRDGIFAMNDNVTVEKLYEPGQAMYLSPGLAFAPDKDTLYVVHADEDLVTIVDFERQRVETLEIQTKLTWFEQLLSLTAGVAHAKVGDGIVRQAVVSPEGQFLYVVGINNSTSQGQNGNWQMKQTPLGLEIIQTSDGSRVEQIETDTTELSLSPDGRFLYLRNWGNNQDNIPWTEIFDTASQQIVARVDKISAMPAFLMNGEFLLASTYSTSETSHHMSVLQPDGSSVLAEWTDSKYIWWLTP